MGSLQRYFLEIAYKGTEFHGWQVQPGVVTVQSEFERSISTVLGKTTSVVGCGRTDTGVHAKQFFLHFEHEDLLDEQLVRSLNGVLHKDVAVKRIIPVSLEDHARFSATQRAYEYRVHLGKDPFKTGRSLMVYHKLDVEKMNKAAELLLGRQEFTSFCRTGSDVKTHFCDVRRAEWNVGNGCYIFYISADRFLRNMVRAVVGTLMDVGAGRMSVDGFQAVIDAKDRRKASKSALACGLFLTEVQYPNIEPA